MSENYDDEALFSRDVEGKLVRVSAATAVQYDEMVKIVFALEMTDDQTLVKSHEVTIPRAVPTTDAQGNILRDANNETIPRNTTIYDAHLRMIAEIGRQEDRRLEERKDPNPIPIPNRLPVLCHQEHMKPIGVCRICMVDIGAKQKDGTIKWGRKLFPSCQHLVRDGMVVQTINTVSKRGENIKSSVSVLAEMLVARNLHPAEKRAIAWKKTLEAGEAKSAIYQGEEVYTTIREVIEDEKDREHRFHNELVTVARQLGVKETRFISRQFDTQRIDWSSRVTLVDHNSCILCNRCVRACNDVRPFKVIGRTGKGQKAAIGFDFNAPMGESDCVACSECMISCPTGALTFRKAVKKTPQQQANRGVREPVTAEDLMKRPLFRSLPFSFLRWVEGTVYRLKLKDGDILCEQGENGSTAWDLVSGTFKITRAGRPDAFCDQSDVILGEMACMNNQPRGAAVIATGLCEVLEFPRNVLHNMQRTRATRDLLQDIYRARAISDTFAPPKEGTEAPANLFDTLNAEQRKRCVDFFRSRADVLTADPTTMICKEGERADDFYMVRIGNVKVYRTDINREVVLDYMRPGRYFGEIALVSSISPKILNQYPAFAAGRRTASCSALDHVELVRIKGVDFRELLQKNADIRETLERQALVILQNNAKIKSKQEQPLRAFLELGLYQGQQLLVIDLEACTRCDECTKACAQSHDGHNRLIRDGSRFENFLIASACRSCHDPLCLVGCPTDAIHRDSSGGLGIRIDTQACVGCGQCSHNCPFGNIQMVEDTTGRKQARKAITCDQCESVPGAPGPMCERACPHDCLERPSAEKFWAKLYG